MTVKDVNEYIPEWGQEEYSGQLEEVRGRNEWGRGKAMKQVEQDIEEAGERGKAGSVQGEMKEKKENEKDKTSFDFINSRERWLRP